MRWPVNSPFRNLCLHSKELHCHLERKGINIKGSADTCPVIERYFNVLDTHIRQLALELEFSDMPLKNEEGFYPLILTEDITLLCKELEPGLLITSPIMTCPEKFREALFTYLMKANFLGVRKATLGWNIKNMDTSCMPKRMRFSMRMEISLGLAFM
jgi:hypothetical protein